MDGQTIELKDGTEETTAPAQAETTPVESETTETEEQTLEALPAWAQDKLKKLEEERENYKKGMLKAKRTLDLKAEEPEKKEEVIESEDQTEEETTEWDDVSKRFQKQTLSEAEKVAETAAKRLLEKTNEDQAIQEFLSTHPELDENNLWTQVVSNYQPKNGKGTVKNILKDLERAHFLTRFDRGEIDKLKEESFKQGEKKGMAEGTIKELSTVATAPSRTGSAKGRAEVTPGALRMAERLRVDPKQLSKEDDSATAEIKL